MVTSQCSAMPATKFVRFMTSAPQQWAAVAFGRHVICRQHRNICLDGGEAIAPDEGCARRFAEKVGGGFFYVQV
jgi:hypothetical protein